MMELLLVAVLMDRTCKSTNIMNKIYGNERYCVLVVLLIIFLFIFVSCTDNGEYHGIDVSRHQKKIDWETVAKDKSIQFVYVKATEGRTLTDKMYARNVVRAKKYGLLIGSYHFFRMTSGAHEQFAHFSNTVSSYKQDLIPMVDIETVDGHSVSETRDSLLVMLELLENHFGVKPIIYSSNNLYNKICGSRFLKYKSYIGRYGKKKPIIPGSNGCHYLIWQYSERGRIKGIPTRVDLCRFHQDASIKDILLR